MNEFESYLFGLLLSDGNLYIDKRGNKGKVSLEVNIKDADIVKKLFKIIPNSNINNRTRNTNFKKGYKNIIWSNCEKSFRDKLIQQGFPTEDKTNKADVPSTEYSISDFWRGIYDGDGSIGFTKSNEPFISLVTKSENLKNSLLILLKNNFNIIKNIKRNKRDDVYNITLKNEDAIIFSNFLYKNANVYLDRKYNNYILFNSWTRTKEKRNRRTWTEEEDNYILTHSIKESVKYLNRTESSIKNRKYRINSKKE